MSARRQGSVVPAMVLILALATGCGGGGVEGSYYNTVTGDFAFELKGGRVYTANGEEDPNLKYEVRGDEVVLLPKDGAEEGRRAPPATGAGRRPEHGHAGQDQETVIAARFRLPRASR